MYCKDENNIQVNKDTPKIRQVISLKHHFFAAYFHAEMLTLRQKQNPMKVWILIIPFYLPVLDVVLTMISRQMWPIFSGYSYQILFCFHCSASLISERERWAIFQCKAMQNNTEMSFGVEIKYSTHIQRAALRFIYDSVCFIYSDCAHPSQ